MVVGHFLIFGESANSFCREFIFKRQRLEWCKDGIAAILNYFRYSSQDKSLFKEWNKLHNFHLWTAILSLGDFMGEIGKVS